MFISSVQAQAAETSAAANLASFLPLVVVFAVFYFLMIRPQMKKAKQQKAMMDSLKVEDEIVTSSGILGTVKKLSGNYITVAIHQTRGEAIELILQKQSIQHLLPKGTLQQL